EEFAPGYQRNLAIADRLLARLRPGWERMEMALGRINEIRNSIIGLQTVNWSEHIYPLVAALNAAGVEGLHYPEAQQRFGAMLERTREAEAEAARYRGIVKGVQGALMDAATVAVPDLGEDLYAAVSQLTTQRDALRADLRACAEALN